MKVSMKTTILDVTVYHCTDGEEEHYCVDENGYLALHNYLIKDEYHAKEISECEGILFYRKIHIRYNPKLDRGEDDDTSGANAKGCRASEIIP